MPGSHSRNKGAQFEREVAKMFEEATGKDCHRCLIETQQGNKGDIATEAPYTIQCKVGQRPNPLKAYQEAKDAAPEGDLPVAVIKKNGAGRRPATLVAVVDLEDFLDMVRKLS